MTNNPDLAVGWMSHCILITPSDEYEAWIEAVRAAAEAQQMRVVVTHDEFEQPPSSADGATEIIITLRKQVLRPAADAAVAVISTGVQTAMCATTRLTGALDRDAFVDASRYVVDALTYPAGRRIDDAMPADASETLEILPGLFVSPPKAAPVQADTGLYAAGAAALEVYAKGLPKVGDACQWLPDLFVYCPRKADERPLIQKFEMTGPPRALVHGPYFTLPAGLWRITARFSVDDEGARRNLKIGWGARGEEVTWTIKPDEAGLYDITMEARWSAPGPAEFRIALADGCMDGEFEFFGAEVTLIGSGAPSWVANLPKAGS